MDGEGPGVTQLTLLAVRIYIFTAGLNWFVFACLECIKAFDVYLGKIQFHYKKIIQFFTVTVLFKGFLVIQDFEWVVLEKYE